MYVVNVLCATYTTTITENKLLGQKADVYKTTRLSMRLFGTLIVDDCNTLHHTEVCQPSGAGLSVNYHTHHNHNLYYLLLCRSQMCHVLSALHIVIKNKFYIT